ncbi:MAG: Anaerobic ribonucleoside-triphosphate reductase [Thermodesulfobacterium sp.]|uniref:Anaerobic ribonucleoside-triphosphate reductase n=1 Tax=Candidatus Thermodesulfobacterium syntrophicum TaxID=3060442 RepID=A0AAE3P4E0_9BACT|nr:Anaerobic ribonucleoside-triphosphate reductase [Candidatus Thermodesulfobacterium syntrophicum]
MEPLVRKRSGKVVPFSRFRIINAVYKAMKATNIGSKVDAEKIADAVAVYLYRNYFKKGDIPHVETIQDIIEKTLMERGFPEVAKAYILYREKRRQAREIGKALVDGINLIEEYLGNEDWRVRENSNMSFSLQGLNFHVSSSIVARYWLEKLYPEEVARAHKEGDFHIHDLGILGPYCVGWDLYDLLLRGFGGVYGKVESKPAKHFRSALGQIVNFFYTLQGECYSADTQVLTDKGWKYFWEVTKDDKVFTLNPQTNKIELQTPIKFYEFDYDGELYHFKSKKLDLLVTPNHNMFVEQYCPKCKNGNYYKKFVKAKDFNPDIHFIPKGGIWEGIKKDYFTLPGIKVFYYRHFLNPLNSQFFSSLNKPLTTLNFKKHNTLTNLQMALKYEIVCMPDLKIPMNEWLKFFGIWLAEGTTTLRERKRKGRNKTYYEYQIRICQNKGKIANEIEEVLRKLPFKYIKKEKGKKIEFVIYNKQLFLYLKQFGKAQDKYIPQEIKNLSREQLEILFEWMMKGDGYIGNGNIDYYTKSKRLADDVQEIVLKLGYSANIYEKKKDNFTWYRVSISKTKYFKLQHKNIAKAKYKGKVYCLEVPNHVLFVRRNGKACWCGNSAGAQAFSNFDTLLAPFVRYDKLSYPDVKQCMQEFLFNVNVPTRVGFQTPFTNLTFDLKPSKLYVKANVIIGGKPQEETYEEFHKEMSMINRAFCELMMEGDAKGRIFTFPIPTYNITKDFDWDNPDYEVLWEMTRKYGIPYFANFVNSDMDPDDARSMCCRLRLDQRELRKRGGGLFGANPLTGSIGVVTINLPRLGYLSTCEEEFFERLTSLMELAKTSLEIKRKVIEDFTEKGLYPYSKFYLQSVKEARGQYWANHFSTIGVVGMNEMCLNFLGRPIYDPDAKEFAMKVLKFMRNKIADFQEETGNFYNLEATPAEGTSYRLAKIDKKKFPRIKTAGTDSVPYYTNSCHLPVNYTDDIFEILTHQDDLQILFTGGTVVHLFVGEEITDRNIVKELIKTIVENFRLPYFSITPTFSVCPVHGYLPGKHDFCPYPHTEEELEKFGIELELPATLLNKLPKEAYKIL